jgi:putative transposase
MKRGRFIMHESGMRDRPFTSPKINKCFLHVLGDCLERYPVEFFSFTVMRNHWRLVLRPGDDGQLGRLPRWGTSTYTQRYRVNYHTSGRAHLYQAHFNSFPVADDDHFLVVCRYVGRGSLGAGLAGQAKDWPYGPLWRRTQKAKPDPKLPTAWPLPQTSDLIERVDQPVTAKELALSGRACSVAVRLVTMPGYGRSPRKRASAPACEPAPAQLRSSHNIPRPLFAKNTNCNVNGIPKCPKCYP